MTTKTKNQHLDHLTVFAALDTISYHLEFLQNSSTAVTHMNTVNRFIMNEHFLSLCKKNRATSHLSSLMSAVHQNRTKCVCKINVLKNISIHIALLFYCIVLYCICSLLVLHNNNKTLKLVCLLIIVISVHQRTCVIFEGSKTFVN